MYAACEVALPLPFAMKQLTPTLSPSITASYT